MVAEEQRGNLERRGWRLGEPKKLQDSSPVLGELKLKEKQRARASPQSQRGKTGAKGA